VNKIICGVDASSDWLDACIGRAGPYQRFANDAEGIEALAAFCRQAQVELVAVEATGGYERPAFAGLWACDIPVAILNPRAVRRFAEAMGLLEKTDRIDAGVIAWFAEAKHAEATPPASETQQRLKALVIRLRQLTQVKVAQTNQRRLVSEPTVLKTFQEVLAVLARQIRELEAEIANLIDADPLWRALDQAFRSIKGVADRTVARLMAELPEIGTLSGKAASKLTGLAPLARDSGKTTGKRLVRGGRQSVRSVLFIVVDCVRRHDPDFQAFHKRLSDAGKPKKAIRIALAHKLLVRLNAKARDTRAQLGLAT
jgi:transposase